MFFLHVGCFSSPLVEKMKWDQVGKLESDLSVHDIVSIGERRQTVLFPAEQEKLLESLSNQVRLIKLRGLLG